MTNPWLERWENDNTGWHEPAGNIGLKEYWRVTGHKVLVPLCGKSPDLLWLAQGGNEVVGVELSEIAVKAFFEEHRLEYEQTAAELPAYVANELPITLYCGDFFELRNEMCDAHYDRGALVALPPDLRPRYADHVSSLLERGAEQLIVTVEYDQDVVAGPPWSVDSDEVLGYWSDLELLTSREDIDNGPPKFLNAGLDEMSECVWRSR